MSMEDLWHQRYGHVNHNDLMMLQKKEMVEGLPMFKSEHVECEGCALGKQHREDFPMHIDKRKQEILELVHTDVCGPMQTRSLGGAYYFLIFIDDITRYTWVYFMRNKSDVFEYFKEFKNMVEKQTGKSIKILRSDQGGEYTSGAFIRYCKNNEIQQQFTVPHTPQQNGVAERKNRTLVECARSIIKGKNISNGFWAEAISTTVYLKNRSATKILENKTPFESFYGYKPEVSHLRIFGSKAFSHIPKEDRRKLDAKAIKCIFIGYCTKYKAYKMFDPNNHKVFASRDVLFHENVDEVRKAYDCDVWNLPKENEENDNEKEEEVQGEAPSIVDSTSGPSTPRRGEGTPQRSEELRRTTRQSKTSVRYRDYALITQAMNVVDL
jgi:transposase InsO family protein